VEEHVCLPGTRLDLNGSGAVRVLGIDGGAVRLAVERTVGPPPLPPHRLCNALNRIGLALHLFRRQWQAGLPDAAATLKRAQDLIEELGRQINGEAP
jgi:hypothetical protein